MSNGFNILNVNGLNHVHMLTIEEMRKKSLIRSNIMWGFKLVHMF